MLERRRTRKQYNAVPGEDDADLELGNSSLDGQHEEGVVLNESGTGGTSNSSLTLEQEVDNWDENAVDAWGEDDLGDVGASSAPQAKEAESKIRAD